MKRPLEVGIAGFRMRRSSLRKRVFLFNLETNSHATQRPEGKKKLSYHKTNIQLDFRKRRQDQTSLSPPKLPRDICAFSGLGAYLCCCLWLLYMDLRGAFQPQVPQSGLGRGGLQIPSGRGRGKYMRICFQTRFKLLLPPLRREWPRKGGGNSAERAQAALL